MADDNKKSKKAANQSVKIESSEPVDDSMTSFMAVVTDVLVDSDGPDDPVENNEDGDDQGKEDPSSRHERHLGLGFAHGMPNGKGERPGNGNSPHNDNCKGNGHPGNPNGKGESKGKGHQKHGNGNGFGHRDCGEPSPAD